MNNDIAKARSIFISAVEDYAPDQWDTFLDDACREDVALRQRVELLLRAHQGEDSFLDRGDVDEAPATIDRPIAEGPGTVIGPYKLLQQIGEGGFGVVFMAEQGRPVRRRVALKVIKPGMDTREVIARFEAERQALAMMDHPNIAKVHDAGATENGRPYFVMELVQGVSITVYCDQCNLTTNERLELFISVCQAVQHAHQKGVIHRDIKPTNVLVAIQDGRPTPKIIDFGVAKAISQRLTEHTLMTAFAQIVGTPLYMSPEQAELSPLGVDTRSDIYSLGVLLYELLTGTTPFDRGRLHAASYDELRRIIREEEPPPPSARISTLAADLASTVADHRRTDARRLRQTVRGELDWIVMKCLEKDRNRRYETAGSLSRDIEHYLHDEPVQACPPSAAYRLKKFIRRNKVGVFASSAVVIAVVAGLALAMAGFVQARRQAQISAAEAAKATAISELLQTALQSANPDQAKGPDYTVRQLLDDFAGGLADQLAGQPDVEADIRATIGNAYRRLVLFDLAAAQYEAALALCRRADGPGQAKYAEILVDYAQNLAEQRRFADAERTAREAVETYRRAGISGRPLVKALWILQLQLATKTQIVNEQAVARAAFAEEQAVVEEALAIAGADGTEYPELANILHRHAPLMSIQGDHAGAEEWARRAVDMHRRLHGNEHPETAYGLADLGRVLMDRKKYPEAESAFREALAIFGRYYKDENWTVIKSVRDELNRAIRAQGDAAGTEAQVPEPQKPLDNTKQAADNLPANRSVRLAQEALERELRNAIKSFDKDIARSPDNPSLRLMQAATYRQVAEFDLKQGRIDEAIDYFRTAVAIASRLVNEVPTDYSFAEERARAQFRLVETLALAERMDEFLAAVDAVLVMNSEAISLFPSQLSTWPLTVDAYSAIVGALQKSAQLIPERAEQAHRMFDRWMVQLDKIRSVANLNVALVTADLYIRIAPGLAADSNWNRQLEDIERRLMTLLRAFEEYPWDGTLAREQRGHKLRLWAFALPWNAAHLARVEVALRDAANAFKSLTDDFPDDSHAWHFLADTHRRLGQVLELGGKGEEAEQEHRRAVELFDEHAAKFDATPINDSERASGYLELASFLDGRERMTEAEEFYRKGLDVVDDPSRVQPEVTNDYANFAYYLATSNRKEEAVEIVGKAALGAKRLTDPYASANALYYVALMQLRLGDEAGYRANCKALFDVPVGNLDEVPKSRPIWTSCLGPNSLEDLDLLVTRAEALVAGSAPDPRHFSLYVLGAALYRAGQYERAAERLEESIAAYPSSPSLPGYDTINYQRLLLAMTKWQQGQRDAARRLLAESQPAVEKELRSPSSSWNRRATLEVLSGEAEALIVPDRADEAPNNDNPTQTTPAATNNGQRTTNH